jgi:hypothetical protein
MPAVRNAGPGGRQSRPEAHHVTGSDHERSEMGQAKQKKSIQMICVQTFFFFVITEEASSLAGNQGRTRQ